MITKELINSAQLNWAEALIIIGKAYRDNKDFTDIAESIMLPLYNFTEGTVLFKPTKVVDKPFRLTREGILSYFIGGNNNFSKDTGFALASWEKIHFENADISIFGNIALAMGHYFFTNFKGKTTKVEYTFGYKLSDNDELKIICHHSSLPYAG